MIYIYGIISYLLGIAVGIYIERTLPKKKPADVMDAMDKAYRDQIAHGVGVLEIRHIPNDDLGATSGCWNPNICMCCNDICNDAENRNCNKQRQQGNHNYPPDLR